MKISLNKSYIILDAGVYNKGLFIFLRKQLKRTNHKDGNSNKEKMTVLRVLRRRHRVRLCPDRKTQFLCPKNPLGKVVTTVKKAIILQI